MRRRRYLVASAVAATTLGLWATPSAASTDGHTVVLVGDSILQSIADEVRPQLEAEGWTVVMQYAGGTGLTPLTPAVLSGPDGANFSGPVALADKEATYDPEAVVVVLGANDVTSIEAGDDYAPYVATMLASTDAPLVRWANVTTHSPDPLRNVAGIEINADLAAVERQGYAVTDYDDVVAAVPDNVGDDGVHLTQAGQDAFAALVAEDVGVAPK